jgi:hypothetical protein
MTKVKQTWREKWLAKVENDSSSDMMGCYNVLLGQVWIHANECVPSTLHQCMIQWVCDEVEVIQADEDVCIAMIESQVDI